MASTTLGRPRLTPRASGTVALLLALATLLSCGGGPAAAPAPAPSAPAPAPAAPAPAPAAAAPSPADTPLSPPVKVRLGLLATLTDAGIFVAMERGYFAAQGLDLEVSPHTASVEILQGVAASQIDASGAAPQPALYNAVLQGIDIRLVADKGRLTRGHGFEGVVVRKDLWDSGQIREVADLRGRPIGIVPGPTPVKIHFDTLLRQGGLTLDDVRLLELPNPEMAAALSNGNIDVAVLLEPFVAVVVDRGLAVLWQRADEWIPVSQNGVLVYSPGFVRDQPEAARRFMVAYLQGVREYLAAFDQGVDREAIVAAMVKQGPVKDAALYERMAPVGFDPNGRPAVEVMEQDIEWFVRHGFMKERLDVARVVDTQYVDYAAERLGRR